jgi:hypothetical protein
MIPCSLLQGYYFPSPLRGRGRGEGDMSLFPVILRSLLRGGSLKVAWPAVLVICRNLSYSLPPILPAFQEDSNPELPVSRFFTNMTASETFKQDLWKILA